MPAAKRVTDEDIKKMNELYLEIGTYAGVAREVGFSGSTVKKYIVENYVAEEEVNKSKITFGKKIPDASTIRFPNDWKYYLSFTEQEKKDMEDLRKEVSI